VRLARTGVLIALTVNAICYAAPPCAVTEAPSHVFVPSPPYEAVPPKDTFYFGSDDLWLFLPNNGVWDTQHGGWSYDRRKIAWFSRGYWWLSQSEKNLIVDAKRLDGVESVHGAPATNAFDPERQESFMFSGIEFPATGCWEISARFQGHGLKFVVWVTPYTASSN
jgi:hypothetical protein